jgi:hypothetical protein
MTKFSSLIKHQPAGFYDKVLSALNKIAFSFTCSLVRFDVFSNLLNFALRLGG